MTTNAASSPDIDLSDNPDRRKANRPSISPPVLLYRLGHALHSSRVPVLPKIISIINRLAFSCALPSTATIGKEFTLGYWGLGVVIHSKSVIGDRCLISQNVTLGRKSGSPGVPRLGNNVAVGAGSVLVGDIELGDNCVVGAGSVVTKSFPDGSVIAGVPAQVLSHLEAGETHSHYLER